MRFSESTTPKAGGRRQGDENRSEDHPQHGMVAQVRRAPGQRVARLRDHGLQPRELQTGVGSGASRERADQAPPQDLVDWPARAGVGGAAMIPVKLLWTPHPHRGGFAIVDHTDGASLEGVRIVYDFLDSLGLRATKTVWVFEPEGPSGIPPLPASVLRGVTLETRAYREYCAELVRRGFEIALHGASAGNNRRDRTLAAFERLERELKTGARTYVCHAKNAENPYWQARAVDRSPLRWVMKLVASRHRCSGEIPTSPYFWGDVCRERVRYVRLFRTAQLNTLAANPSMPYFEREKPYVRGWFTMTDRSLGDATRPEALAMLSHENGLCILRQHLARHADPESWSVRPGFEAAMRRLRGAPDLWVDTAGAMLD